MALDPTPDVVHGAPPPLTPLRQFIGAGLVLPVVAWVATRWWLKAEREMPGVQWPATLSPAPDPDALLTQLLWGGGAVLVAALAARWAWSRWARPGSRVRQAVLWTLWGLWVVVWLAGTVLAWRSHLNQAQLHGAHTRVFRLVAVQQLQPSTRAVGGARLFVDWPEQGGLHQVVMEDPAPDLLAQPQRVTLHLAQGRWHGWFVTRAEPEGDNKGKP